MATTQVAPNAFRDATGPNPDDPATLAAAGRILLEKKNEPGEALRLFRRAAKLNPHSAEIESYYGLCIALVERRYDEARRLCANALERESFSGQLHCNLGHVDLATGHRSEAYESFARGLSLEPDHAGLRAAMARMGRRANPVLRFLPRDHQLNRVLGRWRHRLTREPA